jgi:hypothetical protein
MRYYFAIEYPITCLFKCEIQFLFMYWNIDISLLLLSFLSFELQVLKIYSLHILSVLELPVTLGWWPGTVIVVWQQHIQIIVFYICVYLFIHIILWKYGLGELLKSVFGSSSWHCIVQYCVQNPLCSLHFLHTGFKWFPSVPAGMFLYSTSY